MLNAADIALTPIYGVALTALHLIGWVFGKCNSDLVFKQREWVYSLERASVWGDTNAKFAVWITKPCTGEVTYCPVILADCFRPKGGNIADKSANDKMLVKEADKKHNEKMEIYKANLKKYKKTQNEEQPVEPKKPEVVTDSLALFALKQIKYRQRSPNMMNDGGKCIPKDKPYASLAMGEIPVKEETVKKKTPKTKEKENVTTKTEEIDKKEPKSTSPLTPKTKVKTHTSKKQTEKSTVKNK